MLSALIAAHVGCATSQGSGAPFGFGGEPDSAAGAGNAGQPSAEGGSGAGLAGAAQMPQGGSSSGAPGSFAGMASGGTPSGTGGSAQGGSAGKASGTGGIAGGSGGKSGSAGAAGKSGNAGSGGKPGSAGAGNAAGANTAGSGNAGTANGGSAGGGSVTERLLSLGKVVTANSEQTGHLAPDGNDSSLTTRWCAADGAAGHYWQVDLGASSTVTKLQLTWEKAAAYQFKVEGSTDNVAWVSLLDQTASTNASANQSYPLAAAPSARWVRITVTSLPNTSTWASFFDFSVFGY